MCLQKLPMAAHDGLLRPEKLVGRLAIREAKAEVVSRGSRHSKNGTVPFTMAALRHSGPKPINIPCETV